MNSDRAVEDAFYDLQSHQMATLKAMQGALRATLDRFSPESIRNRAETQGFLASILPAATRRGPVARLRAGVQRSRARLR